MFDPHAAAHLAHHVTIAGMVFRHFRHGDHSLAALKQFYADRGLIDHPDDDIDTVSVSSVEEMGQLLNGLHVEWAPSLLEPVEQPKVEPDGAL